MSRGDRGPVRGSHRHNFLLAVMSQCRAKGYATTDEIISIVGHYETVKRVREAGYDYKMQGYLTMPKMDHWVITEVGVEALQKVTLHRRSKPSEMEDA